MEITQQKISVNFIFLMKFRDIFVSLKTLLDKDTTVVVLPNAVGSREEKNDILFSTLDFMEQNILIK